MPQGRLKLRQLADGSAELIHYHRADTALYAAKAAGRNRVELAAALGVAA